MYRVYIASNTSFQCPVIHFNSTRRYKINIFERLSIQEGIADLLAYQIGRSILALIIVFEAKLIIEYKAL